MVSITISYTFCALSKVGELFMEGFFSQWRLIVKGVINDSDLCKLPQRYQKKSYTHTLSYSGRKQVQHTSSGAGKNFYSFTR